MMAMILNADWSKGARPPSFSPWHQQRNHWQQQQHNCITTATANSINTTLQPPSPLLQYHYNDL